VKYPFDVVSGHKSYHWLHLGIVPLDGGVVVVGDVDGRVVVVDDGLGRVLVELVGAGVLMEAEHAAFPGVIQNHARSAATFIGTVCPTPAAE
jgi:hypothetical protein